MKDVEVRMAVQVGEEDKLFGSITSMDISRKLKDAGFEIDKRKIILESPIRELGEHTVTVRLEEGLTASVKVIVEKA
jgi:large subunit ribosomal protein L9